jgi:hypothetical protein
MQLTKLQQALADELMPFAVYISGGTRLCIEQIVQRHCYYIERDAVARYENEFKSTNRSTAHQWDPYGQFH